MHFDTDAWGVVSCAEERSSGQVGTYRRFMRQHSRGGPATIRAALSRLSLVMVAGAGLSGCFLADPDTEAIDVLNDTGQSLWLDDEPADSQSGRDRIGPHEWGKVGTGECTTRRLEAQTRSGRVIATLHRPWCPGQDWIITAEGQFVRYRTP